MQDMEPSFTTGNAYVLTSHEVEVVYLSLARLRELEQACERRDWQAVETMNPMEESR